MALQPNTLVHNVDGDNLVVESGGRLTVKSGATINQPAGGITLGNISFTGLTALGADGADASSAAADITLTGATVGQRVLLAIGQVKSETATHGFVISTSQFETSISKVDNIVQNKGANLSANTYFFVLAPAAAAE